MILLELRRMRMPLIAGGVVTACTLFLLFVLPLAPDMQETAVLTANLALAVLWVIILFENIASDKEQLPFLTGMPRNPSLIYLKRMGLRILILAGILLIFYLVPGFARIPANEQAPFFSDQLFYWSHLLKVLFPVTGIVLLLGTIRLQPKLSRAMIVVSITGAFSQFLALTFYTDIFSWFGVLFCGFQVFILFAVWSAEAWSSVLQNRNMRRPAVLLMLLPLLQYGGTSAYWNLRHLFTMKEAQAQGIVLQDAVPGDWNGGAPTPERIRETIDRMLEKAGYRADGNLIFRSYSFHLNFAIAEYLWDQLSIHRQNDDREAFAATLKKLWFLTGFNPRKILGTIPENADEIKFMIRLLDNAEHWQTDPILLMQPYAYPYFRGASGIMGQFGDWAYNGSGFGRAAGRIIIQPFKQKIDSHLLQDGMEYLRRVRCGEPASKHLYFLQIQGWNKDEVRFSQAVYRLRLHMLEHGEAPDRPGAGFEQFHYRKTEDGFELKYHHLNYHYQHTEKTI
jgi:hypothetical protein